MSVQPSDHVRHDAVQLDLLAALAEVEQTEAAGDDHQTLTMAEKFDQFRQDNPHVYRILVRLCRELKAAGKNKIGIALVWERMRWELHVTTTETPKLDNSLKAWFARLIMRQEPDLADIFETRRSAADELLGEETNRAA